MKARTKILVALGSVVVLLAAFAGVAYAADGAIPGDTLYGFDCALEKAGLGDGGLQERLREAEQLCVSGDMEAGLNHAAMAVANQAGLDQGGQGNGALNAAANAVQASNQGESEQVRARVAEMLQWMAQTENQGEDFGQGVAERAREIAGAALHNQNQEQNQHGQQNQNQNGQTEDTE